MPAKHNNVVMPAQAGIQQFQKTNRAISDFSPQSIEFSNRVSMPARMDASLACPIGYRWHDNVGGFAEDNDRLSSYRNLFAEDNDRLSYLISSM